MPSRTNNKKQSTNLVKYGGRFTMPGRFRVTVEVLDDDEAKDDMDSNALAQYWQDDHVITLRRSRPVKKRKADLEHELQHMAVDWIDHFIRKARCRN